MITGVGLRPTLQTVIRGVRPSGCAGLLSGVARSRSSSSSSAGLALVASSARSSSSLQCRRAFSSVRTIERKDTVQSLLATSIASSRTAAQCRSLATYSEVKARRAREKVAIPPELHWYTPNTEAGKPLVLRAVLFFLTTSVAAYGLAAWRSVEETGRLASTIDEGKSIFGDFTSFLTGGSSGSGVETDGAAGKISEKRLMVARKQQTAERLGWQLTWLMGWCDQLYLPDSVKNSVGSAFTYLANGYLNLPAYKSIIVPVLALNTGIWLTFAVSRTGVLQGRLQDMLRRNFMHAPAANRMRTMLTSVFAHATLPHLAFNSFAIFSFGGLAFIAPGFFNQSNHDGTTRRLHTAEASLLPHFAAFFVASGTFAALSSHVCSRLVFEGVRRRLGEQVARAKVGRTPSLGSSGAAYALMTMFALGWPQTELSVIFLPQAHAPAQTMLGVLLSLDAIGLFCTLFTPWKSRLDHAAHLGGALFGYVYYQHGGNEWWETCKATALHYQRAYPVHLGLFDDQGARGSTPVNIINKVKKALPAEPSLR